MTARRTPLAIAVVAGLAFAGVAIEATAATSTPNKGMTSSTTTTSMMSHSSPITPSGPLVSTTTTTSMQTSSPMGASTTTTGY